jgi:hypothetical protein
MSKIKVGDEVIVTGNTPKKEVDGTLGYLMMKDIFDTQDLFVGKHGIVTEVLGAPGTDMGFASISFDEWPAGAAKKHENNKDNSSTFYLEDVELAGEERGE